MAIGVPAVATAPTRLGRCLDDAETGEVAGAANRTRTCDPVITNDVLYQLSYCGEPGGAFSNCLKTPAPDIGQRPVLQEKRAATRR
jgi:hypothetical protein